MSSSNKYHYKPSEQKHKPQVLHHPVRQQIIIPSSYTPTNQWIPNRIPPKIQPNFQSQPSHYHQPNSRPQHPSHPHLHLKYLSHPQQKQQHKRMILENKPSDHHLKRKDSNKSPNKILIPNNYETKTRMKSPINMTGGKIQNPVYQHVGNKNPHPREVYLENSVVGGEKEGQPVKYYKKRSIQINIANNQNNKNQPNFASTDNKNYIVYKNTQEPVETGKYFPRQQAEESIYYISDLIANVSNKKSAIYSHFYQIFKMFRNNQKELLPLKQVQQINLPQDPSLKTRKTVIFDLDETLIHCTKSKSPPYEIKLVVKQPPNQLTEVGFNIRPYAKQILQNLSKHFEIIIFTASHSYYADTILNYLDPEGKFIHHRLYREHCQEPKKGFYVKDLRVIPRRMENMILIDNSSLSYCFQPENGVPILSYVEGKGDTEFKKLEGFLMKLKGVNDVRSVISKTFKTVEYARFNHADEAIRELFIKNK